MESHFRPGYSQTPAGSSIDWRMGDVALAPLEAGLLAPGYVDQIEASRVHVDFFNGASGWVQFSYLKPLKIDPGSEVLLRDEHGIWTPAKVETLAKDLLAVKLASGESATVNLKDVRFAGDARASAESSNVSPPPTQIAALLVGERVLAAWDPNTLFPGKIAEVKGDEALIHFEDGDQGWVHRNEIFPFSMRVGDRVQARWQMGGMAFPGRIAEIRQGKIHIHYDDGDKEWTTAAALIFPTTSPGAGARPIRSLHTGRNMPWGCLFYVVLMILMGALRVSCRGG